MRTMSREGLLLRLSYYAGCAGRVLNDNSYALRYLGRAETVTEEEGLRVIAEIRARLAAAGHPPTDPFSPEKDAPEAGR